MLWVLDSCQYESYAYWVLTQSILAASTLEIYSRTQSSIWSSKSLWILSSATVSADSRSRCYECLILVNMDHMHIEYWLNRYWQLRHSRYTRGLRAACRAQSHYESCRVLRCLQIVAADAMSAWFLSIWIICILSTDSIDTGSFDTRDIHEDSEQHIELKITVNPVECYGVCR
jgi:hypothetical protein